MINATFATVDEIRDWLNGSEVSSLEKPSYAAYYDELEDNFVVYVRTAAEMDHGWEDE